MSTLPSLSRLVADYVVLAHKLRYFHWTVRGPQFFALHAEFERLYQEAAARADALAERLLALGGAPAPSLRQALALAACPEAESDADAAGMVRQTAADLAGLNERLRALARAAAAAADPATANLLDAAADAQEKTLWMLRAYLA